MQNGYLLWQAANHWQRQMRAVLAPHGVTPVQYLLLSGLHELAGAAAGAVKQADLARHCGTDPMMTSQVLRTLQKCGLVRRATHDDDGRAVALAITSDGTKVVQKAASGLNDADAQFHKPVAAYGDAFGDALQLLNGVKPRRRVKAGSRG
jgi:DNA-binding MarR family transcriptional regulator